MVNVIRISRIVISIAFLFLGFRFGLIKQRCFEFFFSHCYLWVITVEVSLTEISQVVRYKFSVKILKFITQLKVTFIAQFSRNPFSALYSLKPSD